MTVLNLPLSGVESIIFFILFGIWAGFLFGGFIVGTLNEDETRRMPLITRLLSSVVLVIAAWLWFAIAQGTSIVTLTLWIAIGMSLGLLGDIFMAQLTPLEPYVLYGMGAFGIGHVAYIFGMGIRVSFQQTELSTIVLMITGWWLIAIILWYVVVYRRSKPSVLVYAALPYALLLSTTVAVAMILTISDLTFVLIFIGAVLFLASDLLLAAQLFSRMNFRYISDFVWFLYAPGQMLIVLGVVVYTVVTHLAIIP